MPSKPHYYKVHTPNQGSGNWLNKSVKNKKKKQILTAIIGGYALVAGIFGYTYFASSSNNSAEAGEAPANVSASLRIVEEKDFKVGEDVKIAVTLQNTSVVESINTLGITLYTTNNSVKWDQANLSNDVAREESLKVKNNSISLPVLAPGERVEYEVSGILQDNKFPYLAIQGKVGYQNSKGDKVVSTNRVFTRLENTNNGSGELLSLKTNKSTYTEGQEVQFTLAYNPTEEDAVAPQVLGKIYISKDSEETVAALNCSLGDFSSCVANIKNLEPGSYTALFIDEEENVFSEIHSFTVNGKAKEFVPSSQASLEFPFGSGSINGSVAVIAQRVMNLNNIPSGEKCEFEVLKDDEVITSFKAQVEADRSCFTTLNTSQISSGSGVYEVRLKGTSLSRDIYFGSKPSENLDLENTTAVLKTGKSVMIESSEVKSLIEKELDEEGNIVLDEDGNEIFVNLNGTKVNLGIWHPRSGDYREVSYLNGEPLQYIDGDFETEIPSDYFKKGGYYAVYISVEEGDLIRYSDFVGLTFDDKEIGFTDSGVLVDNYKNLKVGESVTFKLNGVTDKSGNLITQGDCAANVYQNGSGYNGIKVEGEIKDGVCSVVVPGGRVTRSGSALVSFQGGEIDNSINQSRQIAFVNGNPSTFGGLQLEYEPAKANFANNLIIGPVTDKYGNLANAFSYKVEVSTSEDDEIVYKKSINIVNGFGKITLPASLFAEETLQIKLYNNSGKLVKERAVSVETSSEKLILPSFNKDFTSDDNVQVSIAGIEAEEVGECKLTYIKSEKEYVSEESLFNIEEGSCNFNWNLSKFRENSQALVKLEVGEKTYYHIVEQGSGEPSNLFVIAPQIEVNAQNELEISLLSSPITDKNGLIVDSAKARFEYNGTVEEVKIENGLIKLQLPASKIENKDIRNVLDQRFLELGLEVKASVTSINKNNDLSIFLGTKNIANKEDVFVVERASSQIYNEGSEIFKFKSEVCDARVLYDGGSQASVKTHWQAGNCYAQVSGNLGKHYLIFEENGFDVGEFIYSVKEQKPEVVWCTEAPCQLQVLSSIKGNIEANLYDEGDQYKFESESLDNLITIEQNGLNPLKEYLIEVHFIDEQGEEVSIFNKISGELLQE